MSQTTDEVLTTLNDALESAETEASDLAGGVRAVIPEEDIGRAMGVLRRCSLEFDAKRGPSGDNLVVNVEAEEVTPENDDDQQSLAELFR
jgi:hypothetical protein